jgi:RimJ/RimL family protein N-acetyltransferase
LIETRRLLLRHYLPADWRDVHAYAALPEVSRFDSWGPNTEADSRAFIARCIEQASRDPVLRHDFAIELRGRDRVIGGCSIKRGAAGDRHASLGYAIHPDYQGEGFATEAALGLIGFGFGALGLDRIVAQCDTRNGASYRVMEKAGMTRVGTHLNHREIKGQLAHSFEYGIDRVNSRNRSP